MTSDNTTLNLFNSLYESVQNLPSQGNTSDNTLNLRKRLLDVTCEFLSNSLQLYKPFNQVELDPIWGRLKYRDNHIGPMFQSGNSVSQEEGYSEGNGYSFLTFNGVPNGDLTGNPNVRRDIFLILRGPESLSLYRGWKKINGGESSLFSGDGISALAIAPSQNWASQHEVNWDDLLTGKAGYGNHYDYFFGGLTRVTTLAGLAANGKLSEIGQRDKFQPNFAEMLAAIKSFNNSD